MTERSHETAAKQQDARKNLCKTFLLDVLGFLVSQLQAEETSPPDWIEKKTLERILAVKNPFKLKSAQRAAAGIAKAGKSAKSEWPLAKQRVFQQHLVRFVEAYVERNDGHLRFNNQVYHTCYRDMLLRLKLGTLQRSVAVLENFEAHRSRVIFSEGLSLGILTEDDSAKLKGLEDNLEDPLKVKPLSKIPLWGIAWQRREFKPNFSTIDKQFHQIELALRLVRPEVVGFRVDLSYSVDPLASGLGTTRGIQFGRWLLVDSPYFLGVVEEKQVKAIWRALQSNPLPNSYKVAVHRFAQTYMNRRAEDKLIDAWIALENIFMQDGDHREATYRMALRIAYFLAKSSKERIQIDSDIRKSYNLRSDVVHGRSYKNAELAEVLARTTEYLRNALKTIVLSRTVLDVQRLDRAVRAGQRPGAMK